VAKEIAEEEGEVQQEKGRDMPLMEECGVAHRMCPDNFPLRCIISQRMS